MKTYEKEIMLEVAKGNIKASIELCIKNKVSAKHYGEIVAIVARIQSADDKKGVCNGNK